jgi:hypothetical protein
MGRAWAVAGGLLTAVALVVFVGVYRDLAAFRGAPVCSGAAGPDCVAVEEATVTAKRVEGTRQSGLVGQFGPGAPMGPDPFPPTPPSPPSFPSSSDSGPSYRVAVARAGREPEELTVTYDLYEVADPGDRARLRVWRGDVVGIELEGRSSASAPRAAWWVAATMVAAWFGAGVVARSLRDRHRASFGGGDLFAWGWLALWTTGATVVAATGGTLAVVVAVAFWWFGAAVADTFLNGGGRTGLTVPVYALLGPLLLGTGVVLQRGLVGVPAGVALLAAWVAVPTVAIWFHRELPGTDRPRRRR